MILFVCMRIVYTRMYNTSTKSILLRNVFGVDYVFYEETLLIDYNSQNRAKTAGGGEQRMGNNFFFVEPIMMRFAIH